MGSQLMLYSILSMSLLLTASWTSRDRSTCTHRCVECGSGEGMCRCKSEQCHRLQHTGTPRSASSSLGRRAGPCWDSWCPQWIKLASLKCNSVHTTFQTHFILHFPKADFGPADHNYLSCHLPAAVHKQNWSAKYSHWENRGRCECKRQKIKPN